MIIIKEEFVGGEKWRRALKLGGDAAIVLWVALKCFAAQHPSLEGFIPDEDLDELPGAPKAPRKLLKALIDCGCRQLDGTRGPGLIEPAEGGWRLHDYLDHSAAPEELELRRERARLRKQQQRQEQRRQLELIRAQSRELSPPVPRVSRELSHEMSQGVPRLSHEVSTPLSTAESTPRAAPAASLSQGESLAGAGAPAPASGRGRARPQPNPTQPNPTHESDPDPERTRAALLGVTWVDPATVEACTVAVHGVVRWTSVPCDEPPQEYLAQASLAGVGAAQARSTWAHYRTAGLPPSGVERLIPWLVQQAKSYLTKHAQAGSRRHGSAQPDAGKTGWEHLEEQHR